MYSVKSAYHLFKEGNWSLIRELCPSKGENFPLPNLQGLSPQSNMYFARGVFCDNGLENNWHCFLTCEYSKEFWVQAQFWDSMDPLLLQGFFYHDFMEHLRTMGL